MIAFLLIVFLLKGSGRVTVRATNRVFVWVP